MIQSLLLVVRSLLLFIGLSNWNVNAWNEWQYSVTWDDSGDIDIINSKIASWEFIWGNLSKSALNEFPRPRRGHSLVIVETQLDAAEDFQGETYLVMFGGRDNDGKVSHIPKTFNVSVEDGVSEFTTYDQKPVNPCFDFQGKYYSQQERSHCSNSDSTLIDVGVIYNDVWAYRLCPTNIAANVSGSSRYFDGPCEGSGWVLWHPGALQGGCTIVLGIEVCTVPSERYNHGAVMFMDGTMYMYGGYSQRCADYCDDIWFFDIYLKAWRQIYKEDSLTYLTQEIFSYTIYPYSYSNIEVPVDNSSAKHSGPGKRWRHSMTLIPQSYNSSFFENKTSRVQMMIVFGGHRLWHGFAPDNSQDNNWSNFNTMENGGFLNDLWIYTKQLDFITIPGSTYKTTNGFWKIVYPIEQCQADPGLSWASRFNISCEIIWPSARAGHGADFDSERNLLWIFGGYSTYFPYLNTDGPGSGPGISSVGYGGFIPYPGYPYFKNDLWYFNLSSDLWVQIEYPKDMNTPDARVDMVLLVVNDILFMYGGYGDNYYYDDTWYFNITTLQWIQKSEFVHPIYPSECTDDLEYILENNCIELSPLPSIARQEYAPFSPISDNLVPLILSNGTILLPSLQMGTAPRQYVRPVTYNNVTYYRYCTSVYGEPTREMPLDGLAGRASSSVFIPQPRRKRPGWDGCRDRYDGHIDVSQGLQYLHPNPRASHKAILHKSSNEIFLFGGQGYTLQKPQNNSISWETLVFSDMWYYNLNHCITNCSNHGDCSYGYCTCWTGYYGQDCSNTTCPGSFCTYDSYHTQICIHGCSNGYNHTDDDVYIPEISKLPCDINNPYWQGESNGICDGFGTSQCAPPFLGEDCSIKDCKYNCSYNGWCSVEYPVSRCMCIPGYYGEYCELVACLNNCSYPNGVCDTSTGSCRCNNMYNPYNNSEVFFPWDGLDCSYIMAYAAASPQAPFSIMWMVLLFALVTSSLLLQYISLPSDYDV